MRIITKLILIVFLISSCKTIDKKGMTLKNKYVFKNEIRMDGYYLSENQDENKMIIYFFGNGTYYMNGVDSINNVNCPEVSPYRNYIDLWGYFDIKNDTISMQMPFPVNGVGTIIKKTYSILENDSTIIIYKIKTRGSSTKLNQRYYFHKCVNKPDSTNILMTW